MYFILCLMKLRYIKLLSNKILYIKLTGICQIHADFLEYYFLVITNCPCNFIFFGMVIAYAFLADFLPFSCSPN